MDSGPRAEVASCLPQIPLQCNHHLGGRSPCGRMGGRTREPSTGTAQAREVRAPARSSSTKRVPPQSGQSRVLVRLRKCGSLSQKSPAAACAAAGLHCTKSLGRSGS